MALKSCSYKIYRLRELTSRRQIGVALVAWPDGGALRTEHYEVIDPRRLSPEHREGLKAALLAAMALPREGEA